LIASARSASIKNSIVGTGRDDRTYLSVAGS
jgi:hypothetical protein